MPNRVVHFEIEAKDSKRASKFYAKAFGWDMQVQGKDFGDYIVAMTGKQNDPKDMGINGGIYKTEKEKEVNAYRCVIGVDNIKKAMKSVKAAGGKIKRPHGVPRVAGQRIGRAARAVRNLPHLCAALRG